MYGKSLILATTLLGTHSRAAVLPRASIDHDAVVGFDQTVPSGTTGEVYLAYQPDLYVVNGCVPFPAVDAEGNTKYVSKLPCTQEMNSFMLIMPTAPASSQPGIPVGAAVAVPAKSMSEAAHRETIMPLCTLGTSPKTSHPPA